MTEDMILADEGMNAISVASDLTSQSSFYCSFKPETNEDKAKLYNMMNDVDERLSDHVNNALEIKDVFVEPVSLTREDGTVTVCPRVVLMDVNGITYGCVSMGVYNAMKKLIAVYGEPTWDGLKIVPKQIQKDKRRMLTISVAR